MFVYDKYSSKQNRGQELPIEPVAHSQRKNLGRFKPSFSFITRKFVFVEH